MHELGIAESALELALNHAKSAGATRVERIVLRVGALAGVDIDALQFAFEAILPGSPAEGANLRIETVPAVAFCPACQADFTPDNEFFLACPRCGQPSTDLKQGRELDLVRLELN